MTRIHCALLFSILLALPGTLHAQNDGEAPGDRIIRAYNAAADDEEFTAWVKKHRSLLSHDLIVAFAQHGYMRSDDGAFAIAVILCSVYDADSTRADVYTMAAAHVFNAGRDGAATLNAWALEIYTRLHDRVGQGNVLLNLAEMSFRDGRNAQADSFYHAAQDLFRRAGHTLGQGNACLRLGDLAYSVGRNAGADSLYRAALALFQLAGDTLGECNTWRGLGNLAVRIGRYTLGDSLYRHALPLCRAAGSTLGLGNAYQGLADIASLTGRVADADSLYRIGLSFFQEAGDPVGQGYAYSNLADIAAGAGRITQADSLSLIALRFYDRAGDPRGQGSVQSSRGDLARKIGLDALADSLYRRAAVLLLQAGDSLGLADISLNRAAIAAHYGRDAQADSLCRIGQEIFRRAEIPLGQGNAYLIRAGIAKAAGHGREADSLYRHALTLFEQIGDPVGQGNACKGLAMLAVQSGSMRLADSLYRRAIGFYGDVALDNGADAHRGLARLARANGAVEDALRCYRDAIAVYDRVRAHIASGDLRRSYQEASFWTYVEYADYLALLGRTAESLAVSDLMKARVFTEQLVNDGQLYSRFADEEHHARRAALLAEIAGVDRMLSETARGRPAAVRTDTLRARQARLLGELGDVEASIRSQADVLCLGAVPVAELQEKVLHRDDVLIEFLVTRDSTRAFVVTRDSLRIVTVGIGDSALTAAAVYDFPFLTARNPLDHRGDVMEPSTLYAALFRHIEPFIHRSANVIIVSDRALALVPFEGLCTRVVRGAPEFLVDRHDISYVQSAAVLRYLRLQRRPAHPENTLLAFGDPVYDHANFAARKEEYTDRGPGRDDVPPPRTQANPPLWRSRYLTASGRPLGRLASSGMEVTAVGALFPENSRRIWLRADATEEHATAADLDRFRYILFSCHGLVNGAIQALALSQLPSAAGDGILTLEEILNCEYNAELVALSACRTGYGAFQHGEGVTGLTRGVMLAGARSVLTSLWSVDDRGTMELMVRFFRNMIAGGMDKRRALMEAKRDLLHAKEKEYASPVFWAAFVLYGE